ncbi:hypothetical protein GGR50DRAFT_331471 [Xylaria sp. CBS 124048]|nr:hypothetical protein GGR50DRAFT_331471 [Xylaria sp. CBS 124048]
MSAFLQCNRRRQGLPCSCPTCIGQVLHSNMEHGTSGQQLHAGHPEATSYQIHGRDIPENLLSIDVGHPFDSFVVRLTLTHNQLQNSRSQDGTAGTTLPATNTGGQENTFGNPGDIRGQVQQPHMPNEMLQLPQQEDDDVLSDLDSLSPEPQVKARPKRKSKYGDEPPKSEYGPPWVFKELTATMSPEEKQEKIEYNAKVSEARKHFLRHKNNLAAKKSRERRQEQIDTLTHKVHCLERRYRKLQARHRQLAASTAAARVQALEADRVRLRRENDGLRAHATVLTRRLAESDARRFGITGQLNSGLLFPVQTSQTSQNEQNLPATPIAPNLAQHHGPTQAGQTSRNEAALNEEIDQLLSDLPKDGSENFDWANYQQ